MGPIKKKKTKIYLEGKSINQDEFVSISSKIQTKDEEKYVRIASDNLSTFVDYGSDSNTSWLKDLAFKILKKFDADNDRYKFSLLGHFLEHKVE